MRNPSIYKPEKEPIVHESAPNAPAKADSPLDLLNACIHCGFCLPACPTYQVTGSEAESPRGRLYLMKRFLDESLDHKERFSHSDVEPHLDACLGCLSCQSACPSGVEYGRILFSAREKLADKTVSFPRFLRRFAFRYILPSGGLLRLGGKLVRWYQRGLFSLVIEKTGIRKLLPKAFKRQVRMLPKLKPYKALGNGMSFGDSWGKRVVLATGCVMDTFYNHIHWATIDVLVKQGYYVIIPDQTCCGALAHHAGENDITKELAIKNMVGMLRANADWIVINSAGCGSAMKDYGELFKNDPVWSDKAKSFSSKVVDVMELLVQKPLAPIKAELPKTITYHAACHLHHAQKVQNEPEALLSQIPGVTLVPLADKASCCGSAGIYNIEHAEMSEEILAPKIEALKATGAETVVTGNPGCMLQIEYGLRREKVGMTTQHPIEILAEAYRNAADAKSNRRENFYQSENPQRPQQ